jgi:hypothetical protein
MSNSILIFSLGTGIGGDYSPTTSAAGVFGIINAVVRKMVWILVLKEDVQVLKREFLAFVLANFIGQHNCVTRVRLGGFAAFGLGYRGLLSSFSDVVNWWLRRGCVYPCSTVTRLVMKV